jgi:alpha-1,3-glucosyltransferase
MILVILTMVPCLLKLWKRPRKEDIIFSVAYAYYCGFMFGWHVHEKASLHFLIPLGLIAMESLRKAREFFFLSIGIYTFFHCGDH